jgi:hypothetical protein
MLKKSLRNPENRRKNLKAYSYRMADRSGIKKDDGDKIRDRITNLKYRSEILSDNSKMKRDLCNKLRYRR